MDNLTHSLVGALLGQAGLKRKTALAMPTLIIAANIPDIDAACFLWLEGAEHLGFRRGITHGPLAMLVLPLLLWAAMLGWDKWRRRSNAERPAVHKGWLLALAFIGTLSHPAMDWLNVYGIRLLEPFSSQWFYGDTLFIIDLWLWGLLIGGLIWSLRAERRGGKWQRKAQVIATVAGAYIFANGVITGLAERDGRALVATQLTRQPTMVVASPVPFAFWEREVLWRYDATQAQGGGGLFGKALYNPLHGSTIELRRENISPIIIKTGDPVLKGFADQSNRSFGSDVRRAEQIARGNAEFRAFLFWSRMPVVQLGRDQLGHYEIVMTDQRFMDPRAKDRFTLRASVPREQ